LTAAAQCSCSRARRRRSSATVELSSAMRCGCKRPVSGAQAGTRDAREQRSGAGANERRRACSASYSLAAPGGARTPP
jgi:hypothetical protein